MIPWWRHSMCLNLSLNLPFALELSWTRFSCSKKEQHWKDSFSISHRNHFNPLFSCYIRKRGKKERKKRRMAKFWYIPTIIYIVSIVLGIGIAFLFRWIQTRERRLSQRTTVLTGSDPPPVPRAPTDQLEMTPLRPSEQPGTSGAVFGAIDETMSPPAPSTSEAELKESLKQAQI